MHRRDALRRKPRALVFGRPPARLLRGFIRTRRASLLIINRADVGHARRRLGHATMGACPRVKSGVDLVGKVNHFAFRRRPFLRHGSGSFVGVRSSSCAYSRVAGVAASGGRCGIRPALLHGQKNGLGGGHALKLRTSPKIGLGLGKCLIDRARLGA
jgi:hypothetical protein